MRVLALLPVPAGDGGAARHGAPGLPPRSPPNKARPPPPALRLTAAAPRVPLPVPPLPSEGRVGSASAAMGLP